MRVMRSWFGVITWMVTQWWLMLGIPPGTKNPDHLGRAIEVYFCNLQDDSTLSRPPYKMWCVTLRGVAGRFARRADRSQRAHPSSPLRSARGGWRLRRRG